MRKLLLTSLCLVAIEAGAESGWNAAGAYYTSYNTQSIIGVSIPTFMIPTVVAPPSEDIVQRFTVTASDPGQYVDAYVWTVWNKELTNVYTTTVPQLRFSITNQESRFFVSLTVTNYIDDAVCPKVVFYPPYSWDRMTITEASGTSVPLEVSGNLKQWTSAGNTPQTVFLTGSGRYYRSKGHALIAKPFNPLND